MDERADGFANVSARQSRKSGTALALRSFSDRVADALGKALREYRPESQTSDAALSAAILASAAEARQHLWRPEDLVAAVRAIESAVAQEASRSAPDREALHALIRRRLLVAYFGGHEIGS